jgi:hypothetical protein
LQPRTENTGTESRFGGDGREHEQNRNGGDQAPRGASNRKAKSSAPETTGTTARAVEPASPHQEKVTGKRSAEGGDHAAQMIVEARKMSEAGDEQGCMKKAADMKDMLGQVSVNRAKFDPSGGAIQCEGSRIRASQASRSRSRA